MTVNVISAATLFAYLGATFRPVAAPAAAPEAGQRLPPELHLQTCVFIAGESRM
jgi:hypothetical protein